MSGNLINSRLPNKNWTPRRIIFTVLFTAISIGINYFGSFLAGLIAFPLYLDSVMTIAVTANAPAATPAIAIFVLFFIIDLLPIYHVLYFMYNSNSF